MALRSTTDEDARIDAIFENIQIFIQDVIDNPSIIERIPDQSTIELTPIEKKEPNRQYVTETPHLAISVKGPSREDKINQG